MKFIAAASTVGALVSLVAAQTPDPFINTPTGVTTCLTSSLSFGGTHPPFTIVALPGGQATGTPIETIVSGVNGTSYSWLVNLSPGTYTTLEIRDGLGNLQYSSAVTVLAGTSTSCVGTVGTTLTDGGVTTSANVPSTTAQQTQTTSAAGSSSSAAGSSSSVSSTMSTKAESSMSSTMSTASHSSTTTSKSGAGQLDAKFGVAGLLGLIGAAAML